MLSAHFGDYFGFAITSFLLALTPGPDLLLVISTAAGNNLRAALLLSLGLACGCLIHTLLLAFGVSVVIAQTPMATQFIAAFGAIYLLYLAWSMWQKPNSATADVTYREPNFTRGLIMNLSNPKVLLFFLALMPKFAQLEQSGSTFRIIILGIIFFGNALLVFSGMAWLTAHSLGRFLQQPKYRLFMDYLTTFIFIVLAAYLIVSIVP